NRFGSLDHTGAHISREELHSYDVLFLAGGHVPTQNSFFHVIGLREKLKDFQGVIIGISAGSMNSADTVYIQPEEPGEAIDNSFCRWGKGLGLTDIMLCPHYQMVKDKILDGKLLYNDITIPDMKGRELLLLNDGSYLHITKSAADSIEEDAVLYGEAYMIKNGSIIQLCDHEHSVCL
ncbi:MAG: Type 1 glutamine amidotransferase-like domain-containing protein, partial [Lachnospiraceae bacterium]|nr:Type 1 glutamine amidotransferase-like domain-containing protein [Lachnospiraceae bacterium]